MVDRARMAVSKWIPMSAAGAAISFILGFVLHLPLQQVIVSSLLTATLVFSGLFMQSFGRARKEEEKTQP